MSFDNLRNQFFIFMDLNLLYIICLLQVKVGDKTEKVGFFHCYKRGVDRVFVDHPIFLEKVGVFLCF